jgi:hypothetical protein
VGLGGLECLCPEPVVLDTDDSSVPQRKDIEDLRSDAEVIVASWAEPATFSAVFDRHFPAIHRYLRRRAGPRRLTTWPPTPSSRPCVRGTGTTGHSRMRGHGSMGSLRPSCATTTGRSGAASSRTQEPASTDHEDAPASNPEGEQCDQARLAAPDRGFARRPCVRHQRSNRARPRTPRSVELEGSRCHLAAQGPCDRAGNRDMGASDAEAFGEPDAVAPEVAASSVQAAAIATNTAATSRRVRTPRDTPAVHLEIDTRLARSATFSLRPRRSQLAELHDRLRAGLIPFAMPR